MSRCNLYLSAKEFLLLLEVLNIHTLLKFQVLNTVSHPELLCYVGKIPFRCCFYRAFLLVLIKPNALQPLLHIEAVIPLFIEVLRPSGYELLLRVLRLGCDLHHRLAHELD